MRKSYLYFASGIGLLITIAIGLHSCKKVNGVDNNTVVETPFSLYFGDTSGAVFNSTDGKTIAQTVFESDGYPVRAICVVNQNILIIKNNAYISTNNGVNFNHSYDSVASYPRHACNGFPFDLNQSMVIFIPSWNYVYITNDDNDPANYLGVSENLYSGAQGDWWLDIPDSIGSIGNTGPGFTIRMTSYTEMTNGTLAGVLVGYDANSNRCFYRTKNTLWNEVSGNPDVATHPGLGAPGRPGGNGLPHHDIYSSPVDTTARYSIGHINSQLIAIDQINCNGNGAYYSNDTGRDWTQMSGIPSAPLLCVYSPFDQICLIGTGGAGLYILNQNTNTWQANNNGLASNLVVRSIVTKQRIYKNGNTQNYIFLATNQGIYQSTDGGNNWTLTIPGNFTAVY